jgi:hypothetical protein
MTFTSTYTNTPVDTATFTYTTTPPATSTYTPTITRTSTLTFTSTLTATPTRTATETPVATDTFTPVPTLPEFTVYPNPFNPEKNPVLRISCKIDQIDVDKIKIKIYTSGYRLIKEETFEGSDALYLINQGYIDINSESLKKLSNGTYYYYISTYKQNKEYKLKVEKLIIMK